MMTEDEAKTKWCPFVRFHGTPSDDTVPNRSEMLSDATRCIGRSCMAWRDTGFDKHRDELGLPKPRALGYCGLAGKP